MNREGLAKLTAELPASRLVDTWSSFAGVAPFDDLKPVQKFTNRKAAVTRIWQAVARLSPDGAQPAADVAPAKGKAKKSPAKAKKCARAQKGITESHSKKKAEVIIGAAAGGPPDRTKMAEITRRHGLTPAPAQA